MLNLVFFVELATKFREMAGLPAYFRETFTFGIFRTADMRCVDLVCSIGRLFGLILIFEIELFLIFLIVTSDLPWALPLTFLLPFAVIEISSAGK